MESWNDLQINEKKQWDSEAKQRLADLEEYTNQLSRPVEQSGSSLEALSGSATGHLAARAARAEKKVENGLGL
jgi:hypothetical protein